MNHGMNVFRNHYRKKYQLSLRWSHSAWFPWNLYKVTVFSNGQTETGGGEGQIVL